MSDLLLGATNPFVSIPQQPDPLTQLMSIVQNPLSIFNGLGAEGGNPFGQAADFSGGGQQLNPLEKLGLIALLASQQSGAAGGAEQPAKPEFPLPENGKPKGDEPIDDKYKTPEGKTKSAKDILDESPICKNLGNQKDIKELRESAKKDFGDWETEKDPEKAARSAIKFRQLLEYSDHSKSKNGNDRGEEEGNGSLSGITKDGDIRDGTEASTAINFFRHGRQFVVDSTEGGRLKDTNDKYVREDGTTRSDVGQVFVDIGKGISHVIPGLGNVIAGAADGIDRGAQKGDIGGAILGGLKGGANGAIYTATNAMSLMDPTDPKGMIDGAKNLFGGGFADSL